MRKSLASIMITTSLGLALPAVSFALVTNTPATTTPATMIANSTTPDLTSILQTLNSSGYPVVKSVELDNGIYEIKAVNYLGKSVDFKSDLNGNLSSKVKGPAPASLASAVQTLEALGYQVQKIEVEGKSYEAKVISSQGNTSKVKVNAISGKVSS